MNLPFIKDTRKDNIVLDEYVETCWHPKTTYYYIDLGYKYTGQYDKFFVHIDDLPEKSDVKILVQCPLCGDIRRKQYKLHLRDGHTFCRRCSTFRELSGLVFGRLTVIDIDRNYIDVVGRTQWICECECGEVVSVRSCSLTSGKTTSCGCYSRELASARVGPLNHNWNPDLDGGDRVISRQYPEYREWRKNVYERDEYTCQVCGDDKGGNLVAHHIFSHKHHPSLRLEVDNGYTMCDPCHREFHSWNGGPMKKCTLDDLNEWLSIEKQREIL